MNLQFASPALAAVLGLLLTGCGKSPSGSTTGSSPPTPETPPAAGAPATVPASAATKAGGPAELRLKWTQGQRQQQRMSMTMKSETSGGPLPNAIKQDVTMHMESSLTALRPREGGGYELEMELGDTDMSMTMGGRETMSFDSRGESLGADNPAAGMFRAMVGAKLKYLLDSSNHVEKVEGWQEVVQKVSTQAPAAGRGLMAGMLTEDYFKQIGEYGRGLPNRTVHPGENWPLAFEVTMGPLGRMVMDQTYTFKGWEQRGQQNCAVITFAGTVSPKPGDTASTAFGKMDMQNGKVTGTSWFNPETGRMVETEFQQDLNMVMDMPGGNIPGAPASPPGGSKMTSAINQKIRITFSPEATK